MAMGGGAAGAATEAGGAGGFSTGGGGAMGGGVTGGALTGGVTVAWGAWGVASCGFDQLLPGQPLSASAPDAMTNAMTNRDGR